MAYPDGESLILTKIQALSNFSASNTARGNFVLVNSGKSAHYCILVPGPFERELLAGRGRYCTTWQTIAQLWVRINNYQSDTINLQNRRQEIIGQFDQYRKAGDTTGNIQDVFVKTGRDPSEVTTNKGALFLVQELVIEWKEESLVTLQE